MVAWIGPECTQLRWVCGGLGLGCVPSGNFSDVSLKLFVNVTSACLFRTEWVVSWYCNPLTASIRYFAILVAVYIDVSMGTQLCCG